MAGTKARSRDEEDTLLGAGSPLPTLGPDWRQGAALAGLSSGLPGVAGAPAGSCHRAARKLPEAA